MRNPNLSSLWIKLPDDYCSSDWWSEGVDESQFPQGGRTLCLAYMKGYMPEVYSICDIHCENLATHVLPLWKLSLPTD